MGDAGKEPSGASKVCKVGMASCVLGVVSGIGIFVNFLITAVVVLTDSTPNMIVVGASGIVWVVFAGFSLVGIIAGIYSCLEKGKSRVPAVVGIGVNALVLLFTIVIMTVGILNK
ncbi:MAG: hypothetical protein QF406_00265 [Verrucomicrobiota bacterium]|jgi:hypothetical protein|nr:hypothetical protein [Verrucomicrobiota bacterium]